MIKEGIMKTVEDFWNEYLKVNGLPEKTPFAGEFSFGGDIESSTELLALVLAGKKKATCTALEAFQIDNEKIPYEGARYVVTDFGGNPRCVVRTTAVTILPYRSITWDMAQKEGEDENMESWKANHDEYFQDDSDIMGYSFTPDMPVVFEEFTLLYRGEE